jgi:hypothetical protein
MRISASSALEAAKEHVKQGRLAEDYSDHLARAANRTAIPAR